ncbi:hypothetical protein CMI37_20555 [Candidatus Pacearchaeota archaeon]|nr:hypothetical protein [Candidatus Pacearchaeota archaeon]
MFDNLDFIRRRSLEKSRAEKFDTAIRNKAREEFGTDQIEIHPDAPVMLHPTHHELAYVFAQVLVEIPHPDVGDGDF